MKKVLFLACLAFGLTGCVTGQTGAANTTNAAALNAKNVKANANKSNSALDDKMSKKGNEMLNRAVDKAADKLGEAGERLMNKMINKIFSNF